MTFNDHDENIDETNIEIAIREAIKKYSEENILDAIFWNSVWNVFLNKYKIKDEFNKNLEEQIKRYGETTKVKHVSNTTNNIEELVG